MSLYRVIFADFLNPINDKKCDFLKKHAIVAKQYKNGHKIIDICPQSQAEEFISKKKSVEIIDMSGKILIPGLYDTHFHWVQDEVRTMPKDNLLKWLENYTWPYENNFKKKAFAKKKAKSFTQELAACGTVGGACYGSIHAHSVDEALANFVGDYVVGNVLMTMNSPDYLLQKEQDAKDIVTELSKKYKKQYAMTPRFAITTDPETMSHGAKVAKKNGSFIQTHLSETLNEIDFVLSIYKDVKGFEKIKTYTEIYDKCNLLGPKTIMGHGIYLSPKELKRLGETQTAVAHCPTSNAPHKELGLGSGLFDYKKANRYKVPWALATDIGGGPFLSMLDVMNSFVDQNSKRGHKDTSYTQALFRSTQAGANVLGVGEESGNFASGKYLNYVVLDGVKYKDSDKSEDVLKKLIKRKQKDRFQFEEMVISTSYKGSIIH